jgi:hypothetical protein
VTAISLAFAGSLVAQADDERKSSASHRPAGDDSEFRWSEGQLSSSLLPQANAVFAALRAQYSQETDDVEVLSIRVADLDSAAEGSDGCELRPATGSRIREVRCYNPTPGEKALNDYQFQEEIRYTRQQQDIKQMQQAELERRRAETMIYGQ